MGGEVEIYSAGFIGGQLQLTIKGIPKDRAAEITTAMEAVDTAKRVYTPYQEMVFLVTLPPETVEAEDDLLLRLPYIPEMPGEGEKGEQAAMEVVEGNPEEREEGEEANETAPGGALAVATFLPLTLLKGKTAWIVGILILAGIAIAIYYYYYHYLPKSKAGEEQGEAKEVDKSSGDPVRNFMDDYQ